jgi:hypothetical protein
LLEIDGHAGHVVVSVVDKDRSISDRGALFVENADFQRRECRLFNRGVCGRLDAACVVESACLLEHSVYPLIPARVVRRRDFFGL